VSEPSCDPAEHGLHHRHPILVRLVFAGLGTLFLLLAAACYARSSRRIFNWLLNNPSFGPLIREWREYRAIPYRAKRIALILIALSFAISITFFVPGWPAKLAMGGGGLILMAWIARIPSRDTPSGLG
jgi:uncharacterized membrane protein YbaN (DUF454 family)